MRTNDPFSKGVNNRVSCAGVEAGATWEASDIPFYFVVNLKLL
jgi:hypothetical protein